MKKCFLLILLSLFFMQNVNSAELKSVQLPMSEPKKAIEEPNGLLGSDDYKIKGRVEYDENGILFLDTNDIETLNLYMNNPKQIMKRSVLSEENIFTKIEDLRRLKTPIVNEYLISPTSGELEYKAGHYTFGTTFGAEMDTAQLEYRTKFFARYDNKYVGFMTAVGKDEYTSSGEQMSSIYLGPELKLGKGFSLAAMIKANPGQDRCRNDLMLRYNPKAKNNLNKFQIEAGMSQMSHFNTGEQNYQFSVSTKYSF